MKLRSILPAFFLLLFAADKTYSQCDASLWTHVYHSYRLTVNTACATITGTVYSLIYEADGDIHIRVTVDSPYTYMLNATNYSGQYGKLVCEPICATTVTQADAVAPCSGLVNNVYIPNVGERVQVIGPYVTDTDHGWNEIHPVTSIRLLSSLGTEPLTGPGNNPTVMVFPNPATSSVNFQLDAKPSSPVYITILDGIGQLAGQYQLLETQLLNVNTSYLPAGKYFYHLEQNNKHIQGGSFVVVKQ